LYTQAFSSNIKEIVKIKESFPGFLSKKVEEIHKVINEQRKEKPGINMMLQSQDLRVSQVKEPYIRVNTQ